MRFRQKQGKGFLSRESDAQPALEPEGRSYVQVLKDQQVSGSKTEPAAIGKPPQESRLKQWRQAAASLVATAAAFSDPEIGQNHRDVLEESVQSLVAPVQTAQHGATEKPSGTLEPASRDPTGVSPTSTPSTASMQRDSDMSLASPCQSLATPERGTPAVDSRQDPEFQEHEAGEGIAYRTRKRGASKDRLQESTAKKAKQDNSESQAAAEIHPMAMLPVVDDERGMSWFALTSLKSFKFDSHHLSGKGLVSPVKQPHEF